jgi:hypothetical protein
MFQKFKRKTDIEKQRQFSARHSLFKRKEKHPKTRFGFKSDKNQELF